VYNAGTQLVTQSARTLIFTHGCFMQLKTNRESQNEGFSLCALFCYLSRSFTPFSLFLRVSLHVSEIPRLRWIFPASRARPHYSDRPLLTCSCVSFFRHLIAILEQTLNLQHFRVSLREPKAFRSRRILGRTVMNFQKPLRLQLRKIHSEHVTRQTCLAN
jgi:hypothetical protein